MDETSVQTEQDVRKISSDEYLQTDDTETLDERSSESESLVVSCESESETNLDESTMKTNDIIPNESLCKVLHHFYHLFPSQNVLINWCIKIGLVRNYRICNICHSIREWKRYSDGLEYWKCTEETDLCEKIPVNEKTSFVYDGLNMEDLVILLYLWWTNCSIYDRIENNCLRIEDSDHFKATLREICIFGCMKESKKIGGKNKSLNVEIGLRMGITCQTEVLIGGIEVDNYRNLFLTHLTLANRSLSEVKKFLEEWIDPESDVTTSTVILEDTCWKIRKNWTLEFNTGSLAEDLWRQRLLCIDMPFDELAGNVSEYFDKSMIGNGEFMIDPNQVNIIDISNDMDLSQLDLMMNPWEFDIRDCLFTL